LNGNKLEKGLATSLNSGDHLDLVDPLIAGGNILRKFNLIYLESLQHVFKLKFTKILQVAPITCHSRFFLMVVMSQLH